MAKSAAGIRAGRAYVQIGADNSALISGLRFAESKIRQFSNVVREAGVALLGLSAAVGVPLYKATKAFSNFEKAMSRVRALTGATGSAFASLETKARELGKSTVFTSEEAAQAMSVFALAGFDVNTILTIMGKTLDVAAAGQIETAKAASLTAKIMASFGLTAQQTTETMDILTKAMTTANTNLEELAYAMKYAGPVARNLKIPITEVVASLQLLANAGLQGEMGGTALRGILIRLVSPTENAARFLHDLGVTTKDSAGNFRGLIPILYDLDHVLQGLGTADKGFLLSKIFQRREIQGINILLQQGAGQLSKFKQALDNAGGSAQRIAGIQLDNLFGTTEILLSAFNDLQIAIGQNLVYTLRNYGKVLTEIVVKTTEWISQNKELTVLITKLTAAVGGLAIGLLALNAAGKVFVAISVGLQYLLKLLIGLKIVGLASFGAINKVGVLLVSTLKSLVIYGFGPTLTSLKAFAGTIPILLKFKAGLGAILPLLTKIVGFLISPWVAIPAAVVGVGVLLHKIANANIQIAHLHDGFKKIAEKTRIDAPIDLNKTRRLAGLSGQSKLNPGEIEEASGLIKELSARYGELNTKVQVTSLGIRNGAAAVKEFQDQINARSLRDMNNEIKELAENHNAIQKQVQSKMTPFARLFGSGTSDQDLLKDIQKAKEIEKQYHKAVLERDKFLRKQRETEHLRNTVTNLDKQIDTAIRAKETQKVIDDLVALRDSIAGDLGLVLRKPKSEELVDEDAQEALRAKIGAEKQYREDVEDLLIDSIENALQRELAAIDIKYAREMQNAIETEQSKKSLDLIAKARELEIIKKTSEYRKKLMNEQLKEESELAETRADLLDNELNAELARIKARYDYEIELAKQISDVQEREAKIRNVVDRRFLEENLAKKQDAEERLKRETERQDTVAELRARRDIKDKTELEKALLDIQRTRKLEEAKKAGDNLALIEEEFALRKELLNKESAEAMGAFSGAAVFRGFGGLSSPLERTARAAEQTAINTKKLVDRRQQLRNI